jgi:transglutaminase-like putative cysteine protease
MMSTLVYREVLRPRWSPQYRALPITEPRDFWLGILSGGQRVGYINARVTPKVNEGRRGTQFRLNANLQVPLFGKTADLSVQGEGFRETVGQDAEFDVTLRSADQEFRAEGTLTGGKLDARLHVGESVTPFQYDLGNQLLVSAGASGLDLPPLKPGEEVYMDAFNPVSMRMEQARITCEKQETIMVMGVPVLTNVLETQLGAIKTRAWVSPEQEAVRVETPFGFTLEKIDPKDAIARITAGESADFVKNLAVIPTGVPPKRDAAQLKIRFAGVPEELMPPATDVQVRDGDTYTIAQPAAPSATDTAPLPEAERETALASDPLVDAKLPAIVDTAGSITADSVDPWEKAERINAWVYEHIEKISVLSVPAAAEVLRSRQGDCNEHTVLFVALARAAGVPARIAIGLVYSDEIGGFGYHAWPEVHVGRWIPMDPTFGQTLADATHVKLLNGGITEWSRLIGYIGHAKVDVLAIE